MKNSKKFRTKKKTPSFCPTGRHYKGTLCTEGDVTRTGRKMLIGKGVKRNRRKSRFVSDKALQVGALGELF